MSRSANRTLRILGTRGVPAAHGGFETFAEQLGLYLVRRGWRVVVYCQEDGPGEITESAWEGIERVTIPIAMSGAKGTMLFDWKSIRHAGRFDDLCLTLGYNTAVFCAWLRLKSVPNLINMDGVEWRRAKWGKGAKAWFWFNDWAGCWLGNHLVADHPEIARHLETRVSKRKITTIGYGAKRVRDPDDAAVRHRGLMPGGYLTLVARAEPENSVLEIIQAFSTHRRGVKLVVVGHYDPTHYDYHAKVQAAASDEVLFVGAIYDQPVLQSLRFHGLAYLHGHQVGGTNPSLVEALGAGNAVIAHDNCFNRWVAGEGACYFHEADDLSVLLDEVLVDPKQLAQMKRASIARFDSGLTWDRILVQYEELLERWVPAKLRRPSPRAAGRSEPAVFETVSADLNRQLAVRSAPVNRDAD
jgi:glycosyltransferase involved in cell wall biosynthesis